MSSQVLALIPNGTALENNGTSGNFYFVTYNGQQGYVYKQNMSRVGVSKEPIIASEYSNSQAMLGKTPTENRFISDILYINGEAKMDFFIYTPKNIDRNLPLVVYLHGRSEYESLSKLKSSSLPKYLSEGTLAPDAIVVMPRASSDDGFGESNSSGKYLKCLINEIVETYDIDISRVSIVGFSKGARSACWVVGKNPNVFSAAVMISGSKGYDENYAGLKQIPVRGYWGTSDLGSNSPEENLIIKLKNAGGNAEFFAIPGVDHTQTPKRVFVERRILDWMISQCK